MKEEMMAWGKGLLRYVLVLLCIAAVIGVILFFATRPQISGSILDIISQENGAFTFDGLQKGMTEEEVRTILDERELFYFSPDESNPYGALVKDRWLTISDEERIDELGRVTIRRTYFFTDNQLTHVELQTVAVKNRVQDDLNRLGGLIRTLEDAFGATENDFESSIFDFGETHYVWKGDAGTSLRLISHYYETEDWVKLSKNAAPTYSKHLDITIRVTL